MQPLSLISPKMHHFLLLPRTPPYLHVCRVAICSVCNVDSDCLPQHYCYMSTTTGAGICQAYSYFTSMTWRNAVAPVVFFLPALVASGAGTTGLGAVNVPIFLTLLSLTPAEVVPPAQVHG